MKKLEKILTGLLYILIVLLMAGGMVYWVEHVYNWIK